jgi:glycosyltransferase involved in cell wall biosynthesis
LILERIALFAPAKVRLAYLFSRYPIVSQTFVDTEMLALERAGVELEIFSIYPPPTSFRHGHARRLKAPIHYAPPQSILKLKEQAAKAAGRWPAELVAAHDRKYGPEYKASLRARNALYFADLFRERGFTHFHAHFANRAAHTALFVKAISGIPFSMSTHGQDYMVDLGNHDLLREICREAVFVANETEWSTSEVRQLCPDSADKMLRVFNGMDLQNFRAASPGADNPVPRIVSVGRLIEFKGFHHLIRACALLRQRNLAFTCEIIGEGPWRSKLTELIQGHDLQESVKLVGALPQEEVFTRVRTADIFTLPCVKDVNGASDVFPTVILEAMASARPVVSTCIAGVPEQIVHGTTGFICQPGDEPGLADALEKLLLSPELRASCGAAGQKRIQTEFAVDHTVKALLSQYEKHVKPAATPASRPAGLAILLDQWPASPTRETELRTVGKHLPDARAYIFHAGSETAPEGWQDTLRRTEFLPDAMVLEGEWAQEKDLRHQLEVLRGELSSKLSTEEFLRQARYALYLRTAIRRDGIRHVHAASARELLTAWLLRKLSGVTISATIEDRAPLHDDPLTTLARECVGVRVESDRFAEKIPAAGQRGPIIERKVGRNFDEAWLTKLRNWSQSTP